MTDIRVETELTQKQRLIVGGIGGITPILATLVAGGISNLPALSQGPEYFIGLGLRTVAFFAVGALFVWLHAEVRQRYPVFRLGVTAPALLAAMIGGAASADAASLSAAPDMRRAAIVAMADETVAAPQSLSDALPPGTYFGKCSVLDGFLGRKCRK